MVLDTHHAGSLSATTDQLARTLRRHRIVVSDAWNRPFHISTTASGYTIASFGRDGIRDQDWISGRGVSDADCDLVYSNGSFVQWPEWI
jgi:hypothetical protein